MIAINGQKFRKYPEAYSLCGFETCRNYHIQKQASCMHTVKPHRKTSDLTFKLCLFKEVERFIVNTLWRFWGDGWFQKNLISDFLTIELHMSTCALGNKIVLWQWHLNLSVWNNCCLDIYCVQMNCSSLLSTSFDTFTLH